MVGKYLDIVKPNLWILDKEVKLYKAMPSDYPHICIALQHADLKKPMTMDRLIRNKVTYYWVLYGNDIVGVVGTRPWTYYGLEILHLVIFPEFRNKGIGRYAVAKLIDESDKFTFYANVNDNNSVSKRLFEALLFKPTVTVINNGDKVIGYMLNKQELIEVGDV